MLSVSVNLLITRIAQRLPNSESTTTACARV